jgi:hypothetical protein
LSPQPDVSGQDARQGSTPSIVRYVLGASLPLVVVDMLVAFLVS